MRILRTAQIVSYLAPSLLCTGLLISSATVALPRQSAITGSTTARPIKEAAASTRAEAGNLANNQVLARNTTAKSEPAPKTTTTASGQKSENKQTISRCWKRLMNMVREVNYAHRAKTKA